jgi:phosphate:Na+ symporter
MSSNLAQKEVGLISFIGNLENIGDIIDKNLMELAWKKLYQGRRFSEACEAGLIEFHALVSKNIERAIAAFAAADRRLARDVPDLRAVIRQRERELRDSHLLRLGRGPGEVPGDLRDRSGCAHGPEADLVARDGAGLPPS